MFALTHTMGRALAHRNYRLFLTGQGISLIGTWMQQVAMVWLVYRLTGSAWLLGAVSFCTQIPSFFLAPIAGVLADRWNRRQMLMATQTLAMGQAAILFALTFFGWIEVWQLMVLGLFLGLVNAFDMPLRQAFLTEMVRSREDVANAIALNSSTVNAARLVGPSLAGFIVALGGEGTCFLLNALSYLAVLISLAAMRDLPLRELPRKLSLRRELVDGARYAFGFAPIRSLLLLLALVSMMSLPLTVLMPLFASQVLRGGPEMLGFLMAASGAGALSGALYLAARRHILGLGLRIAWAALSFGLGMIAFSFSHHAPVAMALLFVTGFSMMIQMAASNTILQTIVEEDKRGRVMSFYTMAFLGVAPFGSLLAGALAERVGVLVTLRLEGAACVAGALLFWVRLRTLRDLIRPIYRERGILPQLKPEAPSLAPPVLPETRVG